MILMRVWGKINENHVDLIAAGVAFYGLLALFPAITALMAIAGLIIDPSRFAGQMETVTAFMPSNVAEIVLGQAEEVASSQQSSLGLAALFALGIALYSASRGVASLMEGMNVAYDQVESRNLFRLILIRLVLTLALLVGLIMGLGATIILPSILSIVSLGPLTEMLIELSRWVVLLAMTIGGILLLYRTAPDRAPARWIWLWPGAILACVLWIAASVAFSLYVDNFNSYNETFGALAGVIVLLMWLWISAFALLLGAELNAEAEAQVRPDSTTGPGMPLGRRGAVKADELAGRKAGSKS